MLTAGNVHDVAVAEELLNRVPLKSTTALVDKAYGKWALRGFIADHDADFSVENRNGEHLWLDAVAILIGSGMTAQARLIFLMRLS